MVFFAGQRQCVLFTGLEALFAVGKSASKQEPDACDVLICQCD